MTLGCLQKHAGSNGKDCMNEEGLQMIVIDIGKSIIFCLKYSYHEMVISI